MIYSTRLVGRGRGGNHQPNAFETFLMGLGIVQKCGKSACTSTRVNFERSHQTLNTSRYPAPRQQ